jgi:ABC-2 type transport system ATP-binding protein
MIQVQNLTKHYSGLCAVNQISLAVRKGEIVGLLGPNGAGKTTTLRMLTGFLRPSAGSVNIMGRDIETHPLEIKKILGYLPESAPLYHEMLVYDYLNYVADIRNIDKSRKKDRIGQLADLCGINEVMHQPVSELSKGYKQRVGLAHAMMNDPEILILDEPTSGLDPNQIVEIRQIIKQIGKEKTIILSTHILSEAEATCDRIVIINRGKIVADDSTENLKESAGDIRQIHLTLQNADFKSVDKLLSDLEGVTGVARLDESEKQLDVRVDCRAAFDQRAAIYKEIKQTDWIVLNFSQKTETLETIFRELTMENA